MTHPSDADLLCEYRKGSQPAFAELVRRHIHLVHASALRQSRGDRHLADDITQAVFLVLARRARGIGDDVNFPGWLVNTTRYAALSALKLESRRRFHEQRATAMAQHPSSPEEADQHEGLAARLDDALSRLRAKDRAAIAMRYLQGKGVTEVGEALGISKEAAQKRIARALARLRELLARRGVTTPEALLERGLSTLSLHVAPTALVSAVASAGTAAAPAAASASLIAGGAMKAMAATKAKLIGTAVAACLFVAGAAAPIVMSAQASSPAAAAAAPPASPRAVTMWPHPAPAPAATQATPLEPPVRFPNVSFFLNTNRQEFTAGIDPDTVRLPGGEAATILTSDTPRWGIQGTSLRALDPTAFRGKRIRFSAFVKCEALANWGSLCLFATDRNGRIYANDDMGGRPMTKTADWTRLEIVCDIPEACETISCGLNLRGSGKLWMDSAQIEVVPNTVPITDDQIWHAWSFSSPHYSTALDPATRRNGRPTRLLQSSVAGAGEWLSWDRNDRHPEQYLGKKMKLSMWIKTQSVTGPSGLLMRVIGPNFQELVPGLSKDQRTIRGTTDWTRYEFTAEIPPDTQTICTGVRLGGKGKLWVDEVRYEVLD